MTISNIPLKDEEVICAWMEPDGLFKPFYGPEDQHPYHWWKWSMYIPGPQPNKASPGDPTLDRLRHIHCDLTLDRLHQVEERLKGDGIVFNEDQWKTYLDQLKIETNQPPDQLWLIKSLVHATAAQKIRALAVVIRVWENIETTIEHKIYHHAEQSRMSELEAENARLKELRYKTFALAVECERLDVARTILAATRTMSSAKNIAAFIEDTYLADNLPEE